MIFITLIPIRLNDGSPVPEADLQDITSGIGIAFGGVTIDGPVTGHWIDTTDGRHYQDESLRVTVACDNDRLDEAETLARQIGRRLGQRSMYFEVRYFDGPRFLRIESDD